MADDFEHGINFLAPESGSPEIEVDFEDHEGEPHQSTQKSEQSPARKLVPRVHILPTSAGESAAVPDKDPILLEIESILSTNLLDIYNQLPDDKREAFKLKGEEVASKIHQMILDAKLKLHKVLKLISDWLRLVPGINVYFLQQEAKIKLDRIVDYANEQIKFSRNQL